MELNKQKEEVNVIKIIYSFGLQIFIIITGVYIIPFILANSKIWGFIYALSIAFGSAYIFLNIFDEVCKVIKNMKGGNNDRRKKRI